MYIYELCVQSTHSRVRNGALFNVIKLFGYIIISAYTRSLIYEWAVTEFSVESIFYTFFFKARASLVIRRARRFLFIYSRFSWYFFIFPVPRKIRARETQSEAVRTGEKTKRRGGASLDSKTFQGRITED